MQFRRATGLGLCVAVAAASAAHGAQTLDIFTIAGGAAHGFKGDDRPATSAALNGPAGVAVAPDGSIVVADTINQRVRRIDSAQRIRTIAGTGARGFSGDGGPATNARLQDPTAVAVGADGSIYIADTGNDRIRKVDPAGVITTIAGDADQGFSPDGTQATAAHLNAPAGVALAADGHVVFSDTGNNRVRAIFNGTLLTIAGNGQRGSGGDRGPGTSAQLDAPMGIALGNNELLIADSGNNKVRSVGVDGDITTVAGTGATGSAGDGGRAIAAQLNLPVDVAALPERAGFFVAEQGGNRVRVVGGNGEIARVAGTGAPRFGGDGRPAGGSFVNAPHAIELMPSGIELLIADTDNNRVRYIAVPDRSSLLAVAMLAPASKGRLVKIKRGHRRTLAVRGAQIRFRLSKESDITARIRRKNGPLVSTIRFHLGAGTGALHLPPRLRSGKHRLTRGHYVVGVTAKAGTASASTSAELIVK